MMWNRPFALITLIVVTACWVDRSVMAAQNSKMERLQKQIEQRSKAKADLDRQQSLLQARMCEIEFEMAESKKQIARSQRAFFDYLKMNRDMMNSSLSLKMVMNSTPAQIDRRLKWIQILQQSEKDRVEELVKAHEALHTLSKELLKRQDQLAVSTKANEKQALQLNEQIRLQAKVLEKKGQKKNVLSQRGQLAWPLDGKILQGFGVSYDEQNHLQLHHSGIEIGTRENRVRASAKGVIRFADSIPGLGNAVIIDHGNNVLTAYGHMGKLQVQEGKIIEQGESLGETIIPVGESSAKVYFEIRHYGSPVNPKDWLAPKGENTRTTE